MEQHAWLLILAVWALLLFFGLAGGDPFAPGQPERAAPAIALARWLHRTWIALRQPAPPAPTRAPVGRVRRPTESGLHAVV